MGAFQKGAEAIAGLSFNHVGQREGRLALGVCIRSLLIAAVVVIGALVHTLYLDNVWTKELTC